MSDLLPPSHPELVVLEALLETCRQTCRLNPSFEVRRAALDQEGRLEGQKAKLLAKLAAEPQLTDTAA